MKSLCSLLLSAFALPPCVAGEMDMKPVETSIILPAHYERFAGFRWDKLNDPVEERFPLFNLAFDQRRYFGLQNEINGWGGRTFTYNLLGKFGAVIIKNGSLSRGTGFEYGPTGNFALRMGFSQDYALHDKLKVIQFAWIPPWVR